MITQEKFRAALAVFVFLAAVFMTGCGGAYKASGQYKRDLLLNRIEKARKCHEQAKKQFEVVLTDYSNIIDANSGQISSEYNKLNKECKKAQKLAKEISRRIRQVEEIGKPLFRDWEDELEEYKDEAIRRTSEEQLDAARRRYLKLIHTIKSTETKVESVLASLNDQVLFLSHNLNKKALSKFKNEVSALKLEVNGLVKHMQNAISEADIFMDENSSVVLTKFQE